jgi:hypothetical protein
MYEIEQTLLQFQIRIANLSLGSRERLSIYAGMLALRIVRTIRSVTAYTGFTTTIPPY